MLYKEFNLMLIRLNSLYINFFHLLSDDTLIFIKVEKYATIIYIYLIIKIIRIKIHLQTNKLNDKLNHIY